jgi:quercetin dioxygenase-like cupin family protein
MLSKIENGQAAAAVATFSKISDVLDIPLSWILTEEKEENLIIQKKEDRPSKVGDESMGYSYELLANRVPYSGLEPTIVHVTPLEENQRTKGYTHSQDEFIFILEGSIKLHYNGEEHLMNKGDSAYFQGHKPHLFMPVNNQGAKVLTLFIDQT